jgi:hypothetical protein
MPPAHTRGVNENMKALQSTRERTCRLTLPSIDLSLVKNDIERFLDKAGDVIFFSNTFEAIMDSFVILAALYIVGHIIAAVIRGWPM